ncbi:MAG: DsbA family oxidoreductase [Anaerolineales bacterium]|nr:DsbA family oxidoreductase [Anaerolineales bacterium]
MDFKLTIFSDYICPWCYVGQGAVNKLKTEYKIDIEWRPFYLRPDTPPEGMDLPEYVLKARENGSEEYLHQLAEAHNLPFVSTKRFYNTRLAHEATEYARQHGKANPFHKAMFHKVYAESQDPSDWSVLRAVAEEVGLDANDMQLSVEGGKYTEEVAGQVQQAYQIGVSGVPTYVINDKYAIVGAQPYEVFKNALSQILKK